MDLGNVGCNGGKKGVDGTGTDRIQWRALGLVMLNLRILLKTRVT
jgi:hypothetical protein